MKIKKWLGLLTAGTMIAALFGSCMGHQYKIAGTVDGVEIPAGLYLNFQLNAFELAGASSENLQYEISLAQQLSQPITPVVLDAMIEGMTGRDWILHNTEEMCLTYAATTRLAETNGITLSEENQLNVDTLTSNYFNYFQQMYVSNGIGEPSIRLYWENQYLHENLFKALYAEGAEKAPSREEIAAHFAESNAHVNSVSIPLTNTSGAVADDPFGVLDEAEALLAELQNGKSLETITRDDIPALIDNITWVNPADGEDAHQHEEDDPEGDSPEEETPEDETLEEGPLQNETPEEDTPEVVYPSISSSYISYNDTENFSQEFLDKLKTEKVGTSGIYAGEDSITLYTVLKTFETDEEYEENRDTLVQEMKLDEFDSMLLEAGYTYSVVWKSGAKKFLSPEKIIGETVFSSGGY